MQATKEFKTSSEKHQNAARAIAPSTAAAQSWFPLKMKHGMGCYEDASSDFEARDTSWLL